MAQSLSIAFPRTLLSNPVKLFYQTEQLCFFEDDYPLIRILRVRYQTLYWNHKSIPRTKPLPNEGRPSIDAQVWLTHLKAPLSR